MTRLAFNRRVNLSKLHDELRAGLPALAGEIEPGQPRLRVEGDDNNVAIDVAGNVDKAAVNAIVAAHDPTPTPAPDPLLAIKAALTFEQLKTALIDHLKGASP